jgi:hypothetical protein
MRAADVVRRLATLKKQMRTQVREPRVRMRTTSA